MYQVFWPEASKWATYVLNISPTLSVKDITPEEAWSNKKPSVKHFRVFGCLAFVHIPDVHRKKLDNKSKQCVFLGISGESKAYKFYDPIEKRIIVSRDVVFEETKGWKWDEKQKTGVIETASITGNGENNEENTEESSNSDGSSNNEDNGEESSESENDDETSNVLHNRTRRKPGYLEDYVTGQEIEEE